jgi:septal ring factor EnvC (AmiA/AmiB activator)
MAKQIMIERKKLLDKLIEYGRMLERFSSEDRMMRDRIVTVNAQLKDFGHRMRYEKDMKRALQREKKDVAAYQKMIAAQLSRTQDRIRRAKLKLAGPGVQ